VLIGADEWDALQETLFWLSPDGNREAVATAREEIAAGKGLTEAQIRAEFGVARCSA
jgi:antitoxin YefM